jgi:ferredoxin
MAKYKIIFDREACIGALACSAIAPELWLLASDGKVDLADAIFNAETKKWELLTEINDEESVQRAIDSAEHCPVNVIIIEKIEQ